MSPQCVSVSLSLRLHLCKLITTLILTHTLLPCSIRTHQAEKCAPDALFKETGSMNKCGRLELELVSNIHTGFIKSFGVNIHRADVLFKHKYLHKLSQTINPVGIF